METVVGGNTEDVSSSRSCRYRRGRRDALSVTDSAEYADMTTEPAPRVAADASEAVYNDGKELYRVQRSGRRTRDRDLPR